MKQHAETSCLQEAEELSQVIFENHGAGSLCLLHKRSMQGCIDYFHLAKSSYAIARERAVAWLTKAFADYNLRDEWMMAALSLLDRAAARRGAYWTQAVPGLNEQVEWLAAVLLALKQSSAGAELETELKTLVLRLSRSLVTDFPKRSTALWDLIIKAELRLLHTLEYNVAVPCSIDLAGVIALDVLAAARKEQPDWPGLVAEKPPAPD